MKKQKNDVTAEELCKFAHFMGEISLIRWEGQLLWQMIL